ncbi:hypothetical protein EBB59_07425 [Lysobacter pythonis]|uniref:Chromosome partitioning protein ParB n=1 Tax=Solilutibacter pythonis TaxID=2483112 RepID=A0A3M2I3I3_9GAMM|nr:hypothetical protein [Lysobacter pythonis]RMH93037.1 hypothetical protein EBB59_07425 [Lysobacter pythonis]
MRKQYHFRDGDKGLLAWDVDKLIALAKGVEAENLPLEALRELDEPYWYDSEDDLPTCRSIADHMRLVRAADLAYPIIICPDGRLMDGMHRVVKAVLEGRRFIRACRLPRLPAPDYVGVDPDDLPYDAHR